MQCAVCSMHAGLSLTGVRLAGPSVLERSLQPHYELTCSATIRPPEFSELDIKWYFGGVESPFLQWVPSSGRDPQPVGQSVFQNRLGKRNQ